MNKVFNKANIIKILALAFLIKLFIMVTAEYYKGESPNYKDGIFFNSFETKPQSRKGSNFLKWQKDRKNSEVKWKQEDIVKHTRYEKYEKREVSEDLSIFFVGHSTFLIQMEGKNILTDPIWSKRASPMPFIGPKRYNEPAVAIEDLPNIDYVLISHNHYEHMDIATIKALKKKFNPLFITGLGNCRYLNKFKNLGIRCEEKNWGEGLVAAQDFDIIFERARHWSKRTLFDTNRSLWGSFVLRGKRFKVYFAGDTGYSNHFKDIGRDYQGFDVALLSIGAYLPDYVMKSSHTNPEEAVLAHLDLNTKQSIGMHFKTFQLSDESYNEPVEDLEVAKLKHGLKKEDFITPNFGQRFNYKK